MEYPKLRPIEAIPVSTSSGRMIYLKDVDGYCTNQVVVSPAAFIIISCFDGKHAIRDIQAEYAKKLGDIILSDKIKSLINKMDENFLLENERFEEEKKRVENAFKNSSIRPAASAGSGYPAEKEELYGRIKSILDKGKETEAQENLKGLIAPHIDYDRGDKNYGISYRSLENVRPDVFIIFGTSHKEGKNFFSLTEKNFETPLGIVKTDRKFIRKIRDLCKFNLLEEEILHKQEHSIELQLPFLQCLFKDIQIVPILCTTYRNKVEKGKEPKDYEEFTNFINALKKAVGESNKKFFFLAGADFSHVGFTFGDDFPLTKNIMNKIRKKDMETISTIEKMDCSAFYHSVKEDEDFRKICGLPPIYSLMSSAGGNKGRLLSYDQWTDYDLQSSVTFAGIGVY